MPSAWVLDLSRLTSRVGSRQLTGVDRLELAWCNHLRTGDEPVFGLIRTRFGFLLVDRHGLDAISATAKTGTGDVLPMLRKTRTARCTRWGLAAMLARHIPSDAVYLNLAHSNAKPGVFTAFRSVLGSRSFIFVHDVIPITHPETQRPPSFDRMQNILASCRIVDGIISSSNATMADIKDHLPGADDQKTIIAPLGPFLPKVPRVQPPETPYFVILGTIEPRKAHDLLFDVWDGMIDDLSDREIPHLKVVGSRGWADQGLFERLDRLKATGYVSEITETDDVAVANILAGANGLLFPSVAEGFGVPALEAAVQGIVPVCAELPVFREILGDIPVYVETRDPYSWRTTILHMMDKKTQKAEQAKINELVRNGNLPSWEDHFNTVLTAIG